MLLALPEFLGHHYRHQARPQEVFTAATSEIFFPQRLERAGLRLKAPLGILRHPSGSKITGAPELHMTSLLV
jgi:hypothetical protein